MKSFLSIIIFVFAFLNSSASSAQTVYSSSSGIKVFVMDDSNKADLKVYKVASRYEAVGKNSGKWFFTNNAHLADIKITFVSSEYMADLKIFFVNSAYQAGWRDISKSKTNEKLLTSKLAGTYSLKDKDLDKRTDRINGYGEPLGEQSQEMLIYPENDTTILFFIDADYPPYQGEYYGRLIVKNGKGEYSEPEGSCKLVFTFTKGKASIDIDRLDPDSLAESNCCPPCRHGYFGNAVGPSGDYIRTSKERPEFFIDHSGHMYYFKFTKPENYDG